MLLEDEILEKNLPRLGGVNHIFYMEAKLQI